MTWRVVNFFRQTAQDDSVCMNRHCVIWIWFYGSDVVHTSIVLPSVSLLETIGCVHRDVYSSPSLCCQVVHYAMSVSFFWHRFEFSKFLKFLFFWKKRVHAKKTDQKFCSVQRWSENARSVLNEYVGFPVSVGIRHQFDWCNFIRWQYTPKGVGKSKKLRIAVMKYVRNVEVLFDTTNFLYWWLWTQEWKRMARSSWTVLWERIQQWNSVISRWLSLMASQRCVSSFNVIAS